MKLYQAGKVSSGDHLKITNHPTFSLLFSDLRKTLTMSIPGGLNLKDLLVLHGLQDSWNTPKRLHKLAFVVHAIVERCHRDARNENEQGFVELYAKWLAHFIQCEDVKPAMQALLKMGVIEQHGKYHVGVRAQQFRIAKEYSERTLEIVSFKNPTLARRIASTAIKRNAKVLAGHPVREAVFSHLSALSFSSEAEPLMESKPYRNLAQQAAWRLSLFDIQAQRYWIAADEDTGRIFHNVTQTPRELRPLLRIDGEEVAEVDIGSAQPYFMLSLYPKSCGSTVSQEREFFNTFVTSQGFYEGLFKACPNKRPWGGEAQGGWGFVSDAQRDRFKKYAIQNVMYRVIPKKNESQVFKSLRGHAPWLASELAMIRSTKAGTRKLAKNLQKQEADLILGKVMPRILRELLGCKPITVHDGILCQQSFSEQVKQFVQEEAVKIYGGRAPRVSVKGGAREPLRIAV